MCLLTVFFKKLNFLKKQFIFLDRLNILISKIIFKKLNKNYYNTFQNKKHFKL